MKSCPAVYQVLDLPTILCYEYDTKGSIPGVFAKVSNKKESYWKCFFCTEANKTSRRLHCEDASVNIAKISAFSAKLGLCFKGISENHAASIEGAWCNFCQNPSNEYDRSDDEKNVHSCRSSEKWCVQWKCKNCRVLKYDAQIIATNMLYLDSELYDFVPWINIQNWVVAFLCFIIHNNPNSSTCIQCSSITRSASLREASP